MRGIKYLLILAVCFVGFSSVAQAEDFTFKVGDDKRNLILEYPKNSANNPVPLVLIFHGGGGNSSWMHGKSTELSKSLLKAGYAVAFMNGSGRFSLIHANTWNAEYCCGAAAKNKIDDVAYIDTAIDVIADKYLIDMSKIYFVGHSNGGMISYRAVASVRHAIKGLAIVSSAIFADQPAPKMPFSLLMIHTKDDEVIPYTGGMSTNKEALRTQTRPFVAFEDAVNLWTKYLYCGQVQQQAIKDALVLSANCADGNILRVWELENGGHKWNKEIEGISLPQIITQFLQIVNNKP